MMEYGILTGATIILNVGIYFFKFPNNFTFGGVSGLSVLVSAKTPLSAGTVNMLVNAVLLVLGFIFLGRDFGIKTVYVTVLNSLSLWVLEILCPMTKPLTDQPLLELIFATLLPAVSAALLFNIGASSGGTDIVAMILRKHSQINIGTALLLVDMSITAAAFLVSPSKLKYPYVYRTFIATQNDKMLDAMRAFDQIINQMPESEQAFNLAKDALLTRMRTDRIIKENVLWAYLNMQDLGLSVDMRKALFEQVPGMTLADVKAFQEKWVKDRKYVYVVLGDEKDLDMKGLGQYGPIQKLSQEEIFGY